jgi:hypothetical protein
LTIDQKVYTALAKPFGSMNHALAVSRESSGSVNAEEQKV